IIREYQEKASVEWLREVACAACGEKVSKGVARETPVEDVPFELLQPDPFFPTHLYPRNYALAEYGGAFLHPKGLSNLWKKEGTVLLCPGCRRDLLVNRTMPVLALCNRFYYGYEHLEEDVRSAFQKATYVDLRLVARYSASNICFAYKDDPLKDGLFGNHVSGGQRFSRGNTVILPRDHLRMESVLPPSVDALKTAFTTVFAASQALDEKAIRVLAPLKASSTRVRCLLRFLIQCNAAYHEGAVGEGPVLLSEENVASIFGSTPAQGMPLSEEESLPACIEIGHLKTVSHDMESDVAGRNEYAAEHIDGDVFYMDACGFVQGEVSAEKYRAMKAECLLIRDLARARGPGKPFLLSRSGANPVSDRGNHLLLGGLFPHLDPFNLGGFDHPQRRKRVDMAKQVAHLLNLYDGPFERDAQFAFVYHNVLQKRRSTTDSFFRVKETELFRLMGDLQTLSPRAFADLAMKLERNSAYRAQSEEEMLALKVLERMNVVRRDVPGTNGYKRARRNEIRALIQSLGSPALYITITPTDIDSGLVRLLANEEEEAILNRVAEGETYRSKLNRAARVARNPGAAARSFHQTMQRFIHTVLRYGKGEGLFGVCKGIYGMVEAQGRGTLHCHMLVWLEGHLNPQAMRKRLGEDAHWKERLFNWLERHIHCELPGTEQVVEERGCPLPKPKHGGDEINPCTIAGPSIVDLPRSEFWRAYNEHVSALVQECNWHEHKATCFSRLKKTEKRGDETCRMGIDGTTRAKTSVDGESGSILLKRLHPRINEYNDVMMFLLKCNMDIQFIGSGEGAKAAIYYITDYITKASLPTHIGLSALGLALQKHKREDSHLEAREAKLLLNRLVNAMMARQEMSHQQIMSYYVGGGDSYCSHKFKVLHWGSFDRLIRKWEQLRQEGVSGSQVADIGPETQLSEEGAQAGDPDAQPDYILSFGRNSITAGNQETDYVERACESMFDSLCIYDFVSSTYKELKKVENDATVGAGRGRPRLSRGAFRDAHPQHSTHQLRLSNAAHVPVILGPTLPRGDRGLEERSLWCRAMLILFKPWRTFNDLLPLGESW
ncbi:hypothetical protein CALCODRAFT_406669, partial [Calocera cornea HHB12733]